MADDVKQTDDKIVEEVKPDEEPKAKEPITEEPTVEEPAVSPMAPADDAGKPAGTDQSGRQLYDVTCASCGKPAQVPFKPSGDRPVYCRDCYMKQRGG